MTNKLMRMRKITPCFPHGPSPIPQEGGFDEVKNISQISGFSHSVGTCALKQGACKLTLNVKHGIIQEALIEVVGCSGMTHSAAMAAEILPGKTILEALNVDLVCDAINVAMREMFLMLSYGRSQSAFTVGGMDVGACIEDLGPELSSQVGTSYGSIEKGPRFFATTEGSVRELALDHMGRIIGYKYVNTERFLTMVEEGMSLERALEHATGVYGRYYEAVCYVNPRRE